MKQKLLLSCGILSSLLYMGMNAFVPPLFEGYSVTSQTVSELSAIGAPTRTLWVWLGTLYAGLLAAFGYGVWHYAGTSQALRATGISLLASGALSLYWPPMQLRGAEFALTDALHIAWSIVTVLLMVLAVAFGALALGRRFRVYSLASIAVLLLFGFLTGLEAPNIAANLPTPWIGVWERISIGAFMAWVLVLSAMLLRREGGPLTAKELKAR
jgi:hypothetical protein